MDVKDNRVDVKGNRVDVKGNCMDVKDNVLWTLRVIVWTSIRVRRKGDPGPGWCTGHTALRWAAGRTGLPAQPYQRSERFGFFTAGELTPSAGELTLSA
eukprot:6279996-Pyramimonas_sp.AAC.1